MFREMRRIKQQVSEAECIDIAIVAMPVIIDY